MERPILPGMSSIEPIEGTVSLLVISDFV